MILPLPWLKGYILSEIISLVCDWRKKSDLPLFIFLGATWILVSLKTSAWEQRISNNTHLCDTIHPRISKPFWKSALHHLSILQHFCLGTGNIFSKSQRWQKQHAWVSWDWCAPQLAVRAAKAHSGAQMCRSDGIYWEDWASALDKREDIQRATVTAVNRMNGRQGNWGHCSIFPPLKKVWGDLIWISNNLLSLCFFIYSLQKLWFKFQWG